MPVRRFPKIAAAAFLPLLAAACAPTTILNTLEPRLNVRAARGLAYGPQARQDLDVYRPRTLRAGAPVVVFLYGGGWDSGEKSQYAFVGDALASHGYLAVVANYRVYPEAHYPDFLRDCAKAVRWAYDHSADYGADRRNLFIVGHSAGAYNALMLALDPRWLGEVGLDPRRNLAGVVGLAGPYDFLPLRSDELKAIFGPSGQVPDSQPVNHADAGGPPLFLAHDLGDKVVYPLNTQHLAARVQAAGGAVETRYYRGLDHALMIGAVAAPLRFLAPVFRDLTAFIDARTIRTKASLS